MMRSSSFARCRSCGASIRFLQTATGKSMPVDSATVKPDETMFDHVRHRSHFASCPNATQHRGKR